MSSETGPRAHAVVGAAAAVAALTLLASGGSVTARANDVDGLRVHDLAFDGGALRVVDAGSPDAPPVLLIHGAPGSWKAYRRYLTDPALTSRAHLIAYDRPGYGDSGRGRVVPSLREQAVAAAQALTLDGSGRPAIVVGHSLGGPIAARFAMDFPSRVAGLVLVAPSVDPDLEHVHWYQRLAERRAVRWLVPRDLRTANEEILPLRGELRRMLPLWGRITAPTIVIHGDRDRLVPVANAAFAARMLPHASVEVWRPHEATHFVLWKRPALIERAILDLLAREEARPAAPVPAPPRTTTAR